MDHLGVVQSIGRAAPAAGEFGQKMTRCRPLRARATTFPDGGPE
jgi:hypothetical protein